MYFMENPCEGATPWSMFTLTSQNERGDRRSRAGACRIEILVRRKYCGGPRSWPLLTLFLQRGEIDLGDFDDRLGARHDAELAQYFRHMRLDRRLGELQLMRDHLVLLALAHELQDRELLGRHVLEPLKDALLVGRTRFERGRARQLRLVDIAGERLGDRVGKLLLRGRFRHVAGDAEPERLAHDRRLLVA